MLEYTLTLEDLEVGKEYHRERSGGLVYSLSGNFTVTHHHQAVIIRKGDRFKEIKKEAEFEEVNIFKNNYGSYEFRTENNFGSHQKKDYKIENGKLLVRDLC